MRFEAADFNEARAQGEPWNVGVLRECEEELFATKVEPVAYNEKETRLMLGGISRSTLYRLLVAGHLERLPGLRSVQVTRASIERLARSGSTWKSGQLSH